MLYSKKEKVEIVSTYLKNRYKNAKCLLFYEKPYELLIAARLSAQCTDERVIFVTKKLFKAYPTLVSFADAKLDDIKKIIYPCGLSNKKSSDIINICKILVEKYSGCLPDCIEELLKLPGVGRKTANLIVGEIFKKPAVVVDTHVKRIVNRLGIVCEKNPEKIEKELVNLIPKEESNEFCHKIIYFGRDLCTARNPSCNICGVNFVCSYFYKNFK